MLLAKAKRDLLHADLPSICRARRRFRLANKASKPRAEALAGVARSYWLEWVMRAGADAELLEIAEDYARKAVIIEPDNFVSHRELGLVASYQRRHEDAIKSLKRAVALAPEEANLRTDYADALVSAGAHVDAMREIQAAEQRGGPIGDIPSWITATAFYLDGDYEAALERIARMRVADPAWRLAWLCHGMLGNRDEARHAAAKSKEAQPDFSWADWTNVCPISGRIDRAHLLEGFRRASVL